MSAILRPGRIATHANGRADTSRRPQHTEPSTFPGESLTLLARDRPDSNHHRDQGSEQSAASEHRNFPLGNSVKTKNGADNEAANVSDGEIPSATFPGKVDVTTDPEEEQNL